jgi:hypothetical protein
MPAPRRAIPNRKKLPVRAVRDAAKALEALLQQHKELLEPAGAMAERDRRVLRKALQVLQAPSLLERAEAQERAEAEAMAHAQKALMDARNDST